MPRSGIRLTIGVFLSIWLEIASAADASAGKAHYATCSTCHGQAAEGNEALGSPRLTGLESWYLVRQLKNFEAGIRGRHPQDTYGAQMVPIVALLPDEKAIEDVVAYIGTLAHDRPSTRAPQLTDTALPGESGTTAVAPSVAQASETPTNEVDTRELTCRVVASGEHLAEARRLAQNTFASNDLVCASRYYAQAAKTSPTDVGLQVEAMTAMNDALHYLQQLIAADLMGVNRLNVAHAKAIGDTLLQLADAAYARAPGDPGVMINKALAAKITDGAYDAVLLLQAIEAEPAALDGLAQVKLGRMLFELPTILGGDVRQSIELLEQAVEISPQNAQALYYLAESYDQELEEDRAADTLAAMLAVRPEAGQHQMTVDMLRLGAGLAMRIRRPELSSNLKTYRDTLLAANPQLMTRVSIAVGGHGGEHPLDSRP